MKTGTLTELKRLLEEWGKKAYTKNKTGCHWDKENIVYKIMKERAAAGQAGRNIALIDFDDEYDRIDNAIKELELKYSEVVIYRYSRPDVKPVWKECKVAHSKTTFYNRLRAAHRALVYLV